MMTANKAVEQSGKNLNAAQKELTAYTDKYTAQANYTEYLKSLDDLPNRQRLKRVLFQNLLERESNRVFMQIQHLEKN